MATKLHFKEFLKLLSGVTSDEHNVFCRTAIHNFDDYTVVGNDGEITDGIYNCGGRFVALFDNGKWLAACPSRLPFTMRTADFLESLPHGD